MVKDKKFFITGANGQLAMEFTSSMVQRGLNYTVFSKDQLDITDFKKTEKIISEEKPDILLNCAAYNLVDKAEDEPAKAFKINSEAVSNLAAICKRHNIFLVHFSSDYVFDGRKGDLYTEDDQPNPLNVYGQSKLKGEEAICEQLEDYLIFRLSWVFGDGQQNFFYKLLQWAEEKRSLQIVSDEISVPTFTRDVVKFTLKALEEDLRGVYHLTNKGQCSRYECAKYYFRKKGIDTEINSVLSGHFSSKAKRPLFSAMSSAKICKELNIEIPAWQDSIDQCLDHYSYQND